MPIGQVIYFAVLVLVVSVGAFRTVGWEWKESFKGAALAIAATSAMLGLILLGFELF